MKDRIGYTPKWTITKYASDEAFKNDKPFAKSVFEGNLLLNEGIAELLLLLTGGVATAFNNANANIGVGNDATAASASQTDLIGASKTYKSMETSYPSVSGQTVTFRAVFGSADGNHAWQEFTVANGTSGTADNLNRKVDDQGTKASGQTWTVDLEITFS